MKTRLIQNLSILFFLIGTIESIAQCPGGYATSILDWDNRAYIHRAGISDPYITAAIVQTQYFTMGKTRVTFNSTHASTTSSSTNGILGVDTLQTGETGSFGTRYDAHFKFNGTITITFDAAVSNVKFSIYDIDYNQRVTVTAANGGTPQVITMEKMATSILTVTGSGTTSANAKEATGTAVAALNATTGNINVTIAGPLTSITIAMTETGTKTSGSASSQEDGSSWLSDIEACVSNASPFPTSYYAPYTQPFTGQPSYFLASHGHDSSVYMINSATGVADLLFVDPFLGGTTYGHVNSLAYDPINKIVYYVRSNSSLTGAGYKTVMKYNATTETISTAIADLNTLGIPVGGQGISHASAAFYDGALYLGIEVFESCNCPNVSGVWRIDFDGSLNPVKASMVFAKPNGQYFAGGSAGPNESYNWGDISIKDGILYSLNFYATTSVNAETIVHNNLLTGAATEYKNYANSLGPQLGQTWDGKLFRTWKSVREYNGTGGWLTNIPIGANACSPVYDTVTFDNSSSDASDPFKPKADFGDAPASYDSDPLSPAVHQKHCNNDLLRIGAAWDREWNKNTSDNASGDASDEDGIGSVTILNSNGISYNHVQPVTVLNNTGANATLGGWLDYDADGVFEISEGVTVTVPPDPSPQIVNLIWAGLTIPSSTPNTFLRIRLVSGSTPLTINNATGWYDNGEVEDYLVVTSIVPLSIKLIDFNAYVVKNNAVELEWTSISDDNADGFEIQRSVDQINWVRIGWKPANSSNRIEVHNFTDKQLITGKTYYRLKLVEITGSTRFSNSKLVFLPQIINELIISPNPVTNIASITLKSIKRTVADLQIRTLSGQTVLKRPVAINMGENKILIDVSLFNHGIYFVELITMEKMYINKMTVNR
jgi:hypothetical protein